jgi:hypothetical protein
MNRAAPTRSKLLRLKPYETEHLSEQKDSRWSSTRGGIKCETRHSIADHQAQLLKQTREPKGSPCAAIQEIRLRSVSMTMMLTIWDCSLVGAFSGGTPSSVTATVSAKKDRHKSVSASGFEPLTFGFGGRRSIQLSYADVAGARVCCAHWVILLFRRVRRNPVGAWPMFRRAVSWAGRCGRNWLGVS